VKRVIRSTRVPIAELPRPRMRSPSQWPGTARSAASAGRWLIMISGETKVLPRPRVRALGTRNTRPVRKQAVSSRRKTPKIARPAPDRQATASRPQDDESALAGLVRRVETAAEGERNDVLYWAACRCKERGMRPAEAEALLSPAGRKAGLPDIEIMRTVDSAMRRAAV
jgi:hypothetical protein